MMDMETIYCSLALLTSIVLLYSIFPLNQGKNKNLPPSPPSIPILGHFHLLKPAFHHSLHALSQRYGPIVSLRLGRQLVVAVSSPLAAEECFAQNDITFANRPKFIVGSHLGYNHSILLWSPYGSYWRNLRRIATITMLSQKQIQLAGPAKRVEVRNMIRDFIRGSESGTVNLTAAFAKLARNLVMSVVNGKPWDTKVITPPSDLITLCDFIPVLRWVGYKGIEKEMIKSTKEKDAVLQSLVDKCRERRAIRRSGGGHVDGDGERKPMIEELLDLQEAEPDYYTDDTLKGLILVMLIAGTDTSSRTLEWAMALLLSHPEAMEKAKTEIATHIDKGRLVDDSDLPKLAYISCIINEALRLFPPAPLLVPHYSSQDCTVGGYDVPKGTLLFVNAWAIHRDPAVWEEPTKFKPERFEDEKLQGYSFNYFPFGMGRRACPGMNFALRNLTLTLATLIQCFDWEAAEPVDLNEGKRNALVTPKEKPLHAICHPRPSMAAIISQISNS